MEIDAESFPYHLLGLFIHISEADFVSFDLELSGIPSRLPNKQPHPEGRKFTLEERYAETKEGADRYQILQVGLTCAKFDYIANHYVLRPYNVNISPLVEERLDVEREISFQSGACSFLLGHGFNLGMPFAKGVQYLSREEAERAKQLAWDRIERKNVVEDLHLKEEDIESLDFVRRVREAIAVWKSSEDGPSSLAITTYTGLGVQNPPSVITRFEKRLVHQLVRAEFPEYVSIGRNECVRIIAYDAVREADNSRRMKTRVHQQIVRQIGFRWVFEALLGGNLDAIGTFYKLRHAADLMHNDSQVISDRFLRAIERLRTRQPVLVGHNMMTDIVYLYRTFIGPLPDTLQEFRDALHKMFPQIIDTKYLATHAEGDLNASPTLQDIAASLDKQSLPRIKIHEDHGKYRDTEAFHEAGYDSLLTATIMIRLAAKLGAEHSSQKASQSVPSSEHSNLKSTHPSVEQVLNDITDVTKQVAPTVFSPLESRSANGKARRRKKSRKSSKTSQPQPQPGTQAARQFQTKNIFDTLRDLHLSPGSGESSEQDLSSSDEDITSSIQLTEVEPETRPAFALKHSVSVQVAKSPRSAENLWSPIDCVVRSPMELVPEYSDPFWTAFGNKLRVFGTEEGVLQIAEWVRVTKPVEEPVNVQW